MTTPQALLRPLGTEKEFSEAFAHTASAWNQWTDQDRPHHDLYFSAATDSSAIEGSVSAIDKIVVSVARHANLSSGTTVLEKQMGIGTRTLLYIKGASELPPPNTATLGIWNIDPWAAYVPSRAGVIIDPMARSFVRPIQMRISDTELPDTIPWIVLDTPDGANATENLRRLPQGGLFADRVDHVIATILDEDPSAGEPILPGSIECLEAFLSSLPALKLPVFSATPKRRLYARWKHSTGRVVGIEFSETSAVGYVILEALTAGLPRECHYGTASIAKFAKLIEAHNLSPVLINEG